MPLESLNYENALDHGITKMPLDHPHSFQTLLPISLNLLSFFHQSPPSLSASSFFFKRSFTSVPSTRRINEAGGKKKPMVTKATEPCNAVNLCGGVGFWPDLRGGEARWLDRGFALIPNVYFITHEAKRTQQSTIEPTKVESHGNLIISAIANQDHTNHTKLTTAWQGDVRKPEIHTGKENRA
ncbi:hypothetical protein AKJ16_DCAP10044 [Drosera capensis]